MTTAADASCALPVPEALRADPLDSDWTQRVPVDRAAVALDWWRRELDQQQLPGRPLRAGAGTDAAGRTRDYLSRGDLFAIATHLDTADEVLGLLWHVLAWGGGLTVPKTMQQRIESVRADVPRAVHILREAARLARHEPAAAFDMLWDAPRKRAMIRYLGPSFFTKYLYFAGGGDQQHPCLILDQRVASVLHGPVGGWQALLPYQPLTSGVYQQYCYLLRRWAVAETARRHQLVRPDEIEMWLAERGAHRHLPRAH